MRAIASTPRSGRDPWAARPAVSISKPANPLCAIATSSSGGLRHDRRIRRTTGRQQRLRPEAAASSSTTAATMTSPASRGGSGREHRGGEPGLHVVGAAAVQAATLQPRLVRASIPATPTVSVCALRSSVRPPPVPGRRRSRWAGREPPPPPRPRARRARATRRRSGRPSPRRRRRGRAWIDGVDRDELPEQLGELGARGGGVDRRHRVDRRPVGARIQRGHEYEPRRWGRAQSESVRSSRRRRASPDRHHGCG